MTVTPRVRARTIKQFGKKLKIENLSESSLLKLIASKYSRIAFSRNIFVTI